MLEGLYAAATGLDAQESQLDSIANDLANLNTPGYQPERVGFEDLLYSAAAPTQGSGVTVGAGTTAMNLGPSQQELGAEQTGQPLDLAVSGNAYFEVKQASGAIALTRNGQFQLDAKGQLTTATGLVVQPPVTVPAGTQPSDIHIGPDGSVVVGTTTIGKVALVSVTAPEQLTPIGDSLMLATAASGTPKPATGASIVQGSLNNPGVSLSTAMSQMTNAEQTYSMASKALDLQAQMLQIANEVRGG